MKSAVKFLSPGKEEAVKSSSAIILFLWKEISGNDIVRRLSAVLGAVTCSTEDRCIRWGSGNNDLRMDVKASRTKPEVGGQQQQSLENILSVENIQ